MLLCMTVMSVVYTFCAVVEFVKSLDGIKYSQEELIQQLLKHFPLLHPGNDDVKNEYLKVIPKVSRQSY